MNRYVLIAGLVFAGGAAGARPPIAPPVERVGLPPIAPPVWDAPAPLAVPVGDRLEERDFRGWRVLVRCATPGGEGILVRNLYPLPVAGVPATAPFAQPGAGYPTTRPINVPYAVGASTSLPAPAPGRAPMFTGAPPVTRGSIRPLFRLPVFGSNCPPSG